MCQHTNVKAEGDTLRGGWEPAGVGRGQWKVLGGKYKQSMMAYITEMS